VTPGDRLGRYRIVDRLGAGGMGEVYRAQDTVLGRMVALKRLRPSDEGPASDDDAASLLHEARAAAAIEHPNAVAIFDVDEADGAPFLAMELIEGETLRRYIGAREPSIDVRIAWLCDIARALGAAHARHLVHRDVKPDNVMIRDDGVVKVLDFGIARPMRAPIDPGAVTRTMQTAGGGGAVWNGTAITHGIRGTPTYMAPEQLRGEPLDGRADQFAWGILACELLTGAPPWTAGDVVARVAQTLTDPAPPPRARNAAIPPHVDAAILRTLAKSPRDRFATMNDVLAALASPEDDPPPPAPHPQSRLGRWLFGGAAALLLTAAFTPSAARIAPPRHAQPVAPHEPAGSAIPAAADAYRTAMQNVRDACRNEALQSFEEATRLDPTFAAAHLRAAAYAHQPDTAMRSHLQMAWQHRAELSAKDVALVEALQPAASVPENWRETETRLTRLAARYPGDAEIPLFLGVARCNVSNFKGGVDAFAMALRSDAGLAMAAQLEASAYLSDNESGRAATAYEECLRISPASTSCLVGTAMFTKAAGDYDALEGTARRLIALRPNHPDGHVLLAEALYARTGDLDEAEALVRKSWTLPSSKSPTDILAERVRLEIVRGRLAEAEIYARQWEALVASSPEEWDHLAPRWYRMLLALEIGSDGEATKLADEYLRQRTAWAAFDRSREGEMFAFYTLHRAGRVDRATLESKRAEWIRHERDHAKATGTTPSGFFWLGAYASLAVTAEDANEALRVMSEYLPLPNRELRGITFEGALGEVHRLAGNIEQAIVHLSAAARWCEAFRVPFMRAQASYKLGLAHEAAGDRARACDAYRVAVATWGRATPRSRTAEQARARTAAIHCHP
jgi:serine/threonine-protein kinase